MNQFFSVCADAQLHLITLITAILLGPYDFGPSGDSKEAVLKLRDADAAAII
jgi:hypothetical protein